MQIPWRDIQIECKGVTLKMDKELKNIVEEYVKLYDEIAVKADSEQVALGLLQEICKDRRMHEIKHDRKGSDSATAKQKQFMKRLGIEFPDDISKKEASVLLEEELAKAQ